MDLQGKTVVITGAGSGMGQAVASIFAGKLGANIGAIDLDAEGLEQLKREVNPEQLKTCLADVSEDVSVAEAIEDIYSNYARIDVCLNFAGIVSPMSIVHPKTGKVEHAKFRKTILVNLVGIYNVMAQCVNRMLKNPANEAGERGVIVNIASTAAFDGQYGQSAYSASKSGIVGMSLPVARELAQFGIRINSIAPGAFETPMVASLPDDVRARIQATFQFPKREGTMKEIAFLCQHICENVYINAECIRIDGAVRLPPK